MDRMSSPRVTQVGVDARLDTEAMVPHVATDDYPELGDLLSNHLPPRVYPEGFYGIDSMGAVICGPFVNADGPLSMAATFRVVSSQHLAVTWVVESPDGERVAGPFTTSTEATEALQQAKLDTGNQDLTVGQVTDEPETVDTGFDAAPNARSTIPSDYTGIGLGDMVGALAAVDSDFRFEVTASWADVRKKAVRLRDDGDVWLNAANPPHYAAVVQGDHGVYETTLMLTPGSHSIAMWTCGCSWASYSWGRSGRWKKFEGRTCSHTLALFYEMQSRGMFGKTVQDTPKRPAWAEGVKPKVWSPAGPPGEWRVGGRRTATLSGPDEVAPAPGETPVRPGWVRMFHATSPENAEMVRRAGLTLSTAGGETYGEPNLIWGSSGLDYYKNPSSTGLVEYQLEWQRLIDHSFSVIGGPQSGKAFDPNRYSMGSCRNIGVPWDIPVADLLTIQQPWMFHYRYIDDDSQARQTALDGGYDNLLSDPDYGKAINLIKARYGHIAPVARRVLGEASPGEAVLSTGNPPAVSDLVRQFAITPVATDFFAGEADDLSAAYRALPVVDPTVVALWERFGQVVTDQANQLRQQYQIIVRNDLDPYSTAAEMHADIDSGTYQVCSLHSFHPIWDVATNVNFRIAHDILGHGGAHSDFSFKGEIEAYQSECAVTPVDLWPALFTEIVAQSAYANTHHLFGEQKVGLITLDQASIDAMVGTVMDGPDAAYDALHYSASARRPATDYGLTVDTSVRDHPAFQAAQQFTGWDSLPLTTVDPTQLIAAESDLNSDAIDRVVSGREPFREGYDPEVVRLPDGRMAIVDGNTRAAMYASLGRPMEVHVWDPSMSGGLDAEAAYYADADLWGGESATTSYYDEADLWSAPIAPVRIASLSVSGADAEEGFEDRLGRCYELAGRMVVDDGGTLIHGSIQGDGNPRIGHAWVLNDDGTVTDPVMDMTMPADAYAVFTHPEEEHRYSQTQVMVNSLRTGHWGPWDSSKYPGKEASVGYEAAADTSGCMVALVPPTGVIAALLAAAEEANPGCDPEPVDQVHITLAYLPNFDRSRSDELTQVVSTFALGSEPLSGSFQGYGVFQSGSEDVLVALPDISGLPAWRERLVELLERTGFPVAHDHGFTPHSTMLYSSQPPAVPSALTGQASQAHSYSQVTLAIGNEWLNFDLAGQMSIAASVDSVRHDEPEPALPAAYGDNEEDSDFSGRTSPDDLKTNSISPGQSTGGTDDQIYTLPGSSDESLGSALAEYMDGVPEPSDQTPIEQAVPLTSTDDPLAQVSRTDITDRSVQTDSQTNVDADLGVSGHRARHPRIAKVLPSAQQRALIDEGEGVLAANLDRLDITGTHYEALEEHDLLDWL